MDLRQLAVVIQLSAPNAAPLSTCATQPPSTSRAIRSSISTRCAHASTMTGPPVTAVAPKLCAIWTAAYERFSASTGTYSTVTSMQLPTPVGTWALFAIPTQISRPPGTSPFRV